MQMICVVLFVFFAFSDGILIIGHRGDPTVAPENTMPSFTSAIDLKIDGIETDLRVTKDDVVVLIHDATVDRTTNGTGLVKDFLFSELEQLDAGSWFNPKFEGTKIPSFEELLIKVKPTTYFIVMDLKDHGMGFLVSKLVRKYGMESRVIASCWTDGDAAGKQGCLETLSILIHNQTWHIT